MKMDFEILETERLFLKKLSPESFKYIFQHYSEAEISRFLGLETHDQFLKEKEKSEGGYRTYDRSILAFIMILKDTNETIGRCGFHNWYLEHQKAELGYIVFKKENRRKGYMNEAMMTILNYGFNVMALNRIEAGCSPKNFASIGILEKYGFSREGYLKQHFKRNGKIEDSLIYSLLKED